MHENRVNSYEGLFLFAQSEVGTLQAAVDHLNEILARAEAEMISLCKWDERRLAYEIKGNKRGLYFLVYFRARPAALTSIERDCNLSERLLRWMVTRADHMTPQQMEAADGRVELEDEIRLRAAESSAAASEPKDAEKVPNTDEPIEKEAEPVPQDITTTSET